MGRVISQISDRFSRSVPRALVAKLRFHSGSRKPRKRKKTNQREKTANGLLSLRIDCIKLEFSITGPAIPPAAN